MAWPVEVQAGIEIFSIELIHEQRMLLRNMDVTEGFAHNGIDVINALFAVHIALMHRINVICCREYPLNCMRYLRTIPFPVLLIRR